MSHTSTQKNLQASCIDRTHSVQCPHTQQSIDVTVSKWQMSNGQWTPWVIVDCPLLPAGLMDCDASCLSQLEESLKKDSLADRR